MKLKEWGFMRHKRYKTANDPNVAKGPELPRRTEDDRSETDPSATIEPTPIEIVPPSLTPYVGLSDDFSSTASSLEPAPMSLIDQPFPGTLANPRATESDVISMMINAILEDDSQALQRLLAENPDHVNKPIGLPFETSNSCFHAHPAMVDVVLLEHPGQTLLDIACGRPSGPVIWVLLMYNAQGSKHPVGTDLALHNAIRNNRPHTVQALFMHNRSHVNGLPGTTWRPLLQAVFWIWPDIVRILLASGADVDILEHSPNDTGDNTALKICLQHRTTYYMARTTKAHCNEILKMLLDAGASLSVPNMSLSSFEMFIKPWQADPYWDTGSRISSEELDCLRVFVEKGADLQANFSNYPCGSASSGTFAHQVLWHSTPKIARFLINSVPHSPGPNGACLLHEVLGSCPDARRHPEDILQDIDVLIQRGVDLDAVDSDGKTPLIRCIENCPAVDLIPCLEKLLDGGADPEFEVLDGIQSYVIAARKLKGPLLSKAMQLIISHIRRQHTRATDGSSHSWHQKHFPVPEDLSYTQLVACTQETSEFMLDVRNMVPEDAQHSFQRAYFAIASNNYLTSMGRLAKMRRLNTTEIHEITQAISMREAASLADHEFDHPLILSLLGSHSPASAETTNDTNTPPAHVPFQLNTNSLATTSRAFNTAHRTNEDAEDFFALSTTQVRWHDPCAKPQPGDMPKVIAAILQFECEVCGDGKLLTKKEVERHRVEHMHSETCLEMNCQRRFCG